MSAVLKGTTSKQYSQSAEIANLRRQLALRGKAIEVMDVGALSRAKATGLLPAATVDAEYRRRTEVGLYGGAMSLQRVEGTGGSGASLSGWMMCAAGCGTAVDLSERPDGYHERCAPNAPRRFIDANFSPVDVDENLRLAEAEQKSLAEQLSAAEERLQSARQAVEAYDRQRAAREPTPDDSA